MTEMTVKRKPRGGFAVSGGLPYYLFEGTKRDCQAYIDRCAAIRAELAQFEAGKAARTAALLAERGIGPVDYRDLKPGDLFTWRPEIPPKVVTAVKHSGTGLSVIFWEPGRLDRAPGAFSAMAPGMQAYGRHWNGDVARLPRNVILHLMGQLAEVIDEVASGKLDATVAADRIRKMRLSLPARQAPTVEEALGASDDPWGPEAEDGGHELGDAFHGGKITMAQYKILAPAVGDAVKAAYARAAGQ